MNQINNIIESIQISLLNLNDCINKLREENNQIHRRVYWQTDKYSIKSGIIQTTIDSSKSLEYKGQKTFVVIIDYCSDINEDYQVGLTEEIPSNIGFLHRKDLIEVMKAKIKGDFPIGYTINGYNGIKHTPFLITPRFKVGDTVFKESCLRPYQEGTIKQIFHDMDRYTIQYYIKFNNDQEHWHNQSCLFADREEMLSYICYRLELLDEEKLCQ